MTSNTNFVLSWERATQFHLMEVLLLWEGRLTSNHLQTAFSIGRSKASEIIRNYQQVMPNNIFHCNQARGFLPSNTFKPSFSYGEVHEYLDLLHKENLPAKHLYTLQASQPPITKLQALTRPVNPEVVRVILRAIAEKQRICACYRSLSKPNGEERLIAPHSLVSAGSRWHVRAFCEKSRKFKDFMLHRFESVPEIDSERLAIAEPKLDTEWAKKVEVILIPNPALKTEQQQLVADDYAMGASKRLKVKLRAPLVKYMVVELRIGTEEQSKNNPKAHQIDLANRDQLSDFIL
ncbi:WYL domain-containing protein [Marinospirillum minutulum]|uniref:WYL domain-containing protein n=1 Tax=Marinospirillum minutulum TaxID=64974 RepID=UPI0004194F94|nr:WYL domain-containing protein [Marinospirillum minutulum]